jgi:uncharacterized protein (DUF305 family)
MTVLIALAVTACATTFSDEAPAGASGPYQPGAPGEAGQSLSSQGPGALGLLPHTEDDVEFMRMMIVHHAQALEMAALVPDRSARSDVQSLARRIQASQADEIALMSRWLERRDEAAPHVELATGRVVQDTGDHAHHAHHDDHHGHEAMAGMLSPAQMDELAAASGEEFDRLFLEFMIYHHEGAIQMVHDLFRSPAGGQDGEMFGFASHVESDQRIEIDRMRSMLATGS